MTGQVSVIEVTLVILFSSLFSLGGGNGPIAIIQDRWVATGLLEPSLFAWAIALGHLTPGPKSGFVAGIGYYMAGWPGAVAAVVGLLVPTCLACAGVSYWFGRLRPVIVSVSRAAAFVVAGMITAAAWELARPMELRPVEVGAVALVTVLIGWRNLEPVIAVLGSAAAGLMWWLLLA